MRLERLLLRAEDAAGMRIVGNSCDGVYENDGSPSQEVGLGLRHAALRLSHLLLITFNALLSRTRVARFLG